jgi:hypothetical protein
MVFIRSLLLFGKLFAFAVVAKWLCIRCKEMSEWKTDRRPNAVASTTIYAAKFPSQNRHVGSLMTRKAL